MKKFSLIAFLIVVTILNLIILKYKSTNKQLIRVNNRKKLEKILNKFNLIEKDNKTIFFYKKNIDKANLLKSLEINGFFIEKNKELLSIYYNKTFLKKIFLKKIEKKAIKKKENLNYLSIIIDDIGISLNQAKKIWKINDNITLSIIPYLHNSKVISLYARKKHLHVMLHMPMEPVKHLKNYKHFLLTNMDNKTFVNVLNRNVSFLPFYEGINNHMGSKLTCNREKMKVFFRNFNKNLFFIDSKTAKCTVAGKIALCNNIITGVRDIFIDNIKQFSKILYNLKKAEKLSKVKGFAIAIGHPNTQTISALSTFIANKEKNTVIIPVKKGLEIFKNYEKKHILESEAYESSSY